jgi:UDPglucose 6-dehydrogenase
MAIVNAEITKISLNSFVTMKISFANMIASVCEKFRGGDVDAVTRALGHDSRIGGKYFRGSVAFGGPCFPRDNRALNRLGRDLGIDLALPGATDRVNDSQLDRVLDIINHLDTRGKTVGILGLSYKPQTNVIEKSFGIGLAEALAERGIPVLAHDSHALEQAAKYLPVEVELTDSIMECCSRADILVVALPCAEYSSLPREPFVLASNSKVVLDCWRLGKLQELSDVARVIPLGTGEVSTLLEQTVRSVLRKAA